MSNSKPSSKKMLIPFNNESLTVYYDNKIYAPTSHTTLLQINNFTINKGDVLGAVVGTGCGLDAIAMAKKGILKVIATDIDKYALEIARYNAEINNVGKNIEFILGNMFEPLQKYKNTDQLFDIVFSSPPILPVSPNDIDNVPDYLNGGLEGTRFLEQTLREIPQFMKKKTARLYINFGSTTNPKKIFSLLDEKYTWKEIARIKLPFSEQLLKLWPYLEDLKSENKAEFWEEHGVPFRWYTQIEAKAK